MYPKTFRYNPQTGEVWEACRRPGQGQVAAKLYGSQMRHNALYLRQLADGKYEVRAYSHRAAAALGPEWEEIQSLAWPIVR
jgi:hypothetical protein